MAAEINQGDERLWIERWQNGDPEAIAGLRDHFHPKLKNVLIARGANPTEAEELLADLWGDCVPRHDDRPALLEKFNGGCRLQSWLATVATRRWIDRKRRDKFRGEPPIKADDSATDFFAKVPDEPRGESDNLLVGLLRECLQAAFAQCPPEALLMLRLVYLHGLTQRELVRMWGWHESKISRLLGQVMKDLRAATLDELKRRDPWLRLTWEDLLELCETQALGFL